MVWRHAGEGCDWLGGLGGVVEQVEEAAVKFWDEIAAESPPKAKVVEIFRKYNGDMQQAGRPYRYG